MTTRRTCRIDAISQSPTLVEYNLSSADRRIYGICGVDEMHGIHVCIFRTAPSGSRAVPWQLARHSMCQMMIPGIVYETWNSNGEVCLHRDWLGAQHQQRNDCAHCSITGYNDAAGGANERTAMPTEWIEQLMERQQHSPQHQVLQAELK